MPTPPVEAVLSAVKAANLSDYEVAAGAKITPQTLANWRNGKEPKLSSLERVAKLVGLRIVAAGKSKP